MLMTAPRLSLTPVNGQDVAEIDNCISVRYCSLPHRPWLSYSQVEVSSDEPTDVACPDCGTPIVLLPLKLYTGTEAIDPGEIFDVAGHTMEAMFAIVDDEGFYKCPVCQRQHRAQPEPQD